ncbi:hypothetical protein PHSY_006284 [Pseudozyma hubeiensis SY62]|uniref:Uncharacterized protein n=1 Tax=Pseudozyma hubeiensis (strain SY62) TaxID=1305764 RepID=R9PKP5_PSEHS|nr:hypothetical protein PHSY_006284 [Pseudozyma hubeiensis SY62]GAC98690.1 hypothetical protein PHSY_006284 [Pseudozyma hubeiensis SY62]
MVFAQLVARSTFGAVRINAIHIAIGTRIRSSIRIAIAGASSLQLCRRFQGYALAILTAFDLASVRSTDFYNRCYQCSALPSSATDFIQELYVKELKGYKAPPKVSSQRRTHHRPTLSLNCPGLTLVHPHDPEPLANNQAADSHKGQVREFQTPAAPKAPAVPSSSELSSQLEAYASSEPDHAEAPTTSSSEGALTEGGDVNTYLREAAADIKVEAHH